MYYRIQITRFEEAFTCPNCSSPVRVVHHPARLYGECTCGAKMEFIQRKPIHVPKVMLNLGPPPNEHVSAPSPTDSGMQPHQAEPSKLKVVEPTTIAEPVEASHAASDLATPNDEMQPPEVTPEPEAMPLDQPSLREQDNQARYTCKHKESMSMKITEITFGYERSYAMSNEQTVCPSVRFQALIEEGDNPEEIEQALIARAKQIVHEQIDLALESFDKPARFYEGPRFTLFRHRNCTPPLFAIVPENAQTESGLRDGKFGAWLSVVPDFVMEMATASITLRHARQHRTVYQHGERFRVIDCSDGNYERLKDIPQAGG